jgi:hypothetical protein
MGIWIQNLKRGKIYQEVINIPCEEIFLKVLSSEMDLTEIKFIRKAFIEERGAEIFLINLPIPHLVRAL